MHFNTLVFTAVTFTLAQATAAIVRQIGNDTATEIPNFTDYSTNLETMPIMDSTGAFLPSTTAAPTPQVITTVETMTLTYTLGPEGSQSVVTTVVETTSTITMTATIYITLTETDGAQSTAPLADSGIYPTLDPTAVGLGNDTFSLVPTATSSDDSTFPTEDPAITSSEESLPTVDSTAAITDDNATATFESTDVESLFTAPPTVTVTDYITTTETVTVPPSGTSAGLANPSDGSFFQTTDSSGFLEGSLTSSSIGDEDDGCGSTLTTTVVEMSTITDMPTSTDILPIDPTISPSHGCGNSTNPTTGYAAPSSGFWTMYRRSRPTRL